MARSEKWVIYEIRHRMTSSSPVITRYQFTDGRGRRMHFGTRSKARLEAGKDKALYQQEERLAAGLNEDQRRDPA
jgi:hypothetical protein